MLAVRNLTAKNPPGIPWRKIKNKILSADYDLSLVFVGDRKMSRLNRKFRAGTGPTNVLSFGLTKDSGEIFIDLPLAEREARMTKKSRAYHVLFLYVHALLHLKGFGHDTPRQNKIMKKNEQKWLKVLY